MLKQESDSKTSTKIEKIAISSMIFEYFQNKKMQIKNKFKGSSWGPNAPNFQRSDDDV